MPPEVTTSPSASSMTMAPDVRLWAVIEPTAVSMSPTPGVPIPETAVNEARPVVASNAFSSTLVSVMAAPDVSVRLPLVLDTKAPRAMFPDVALSVTVPEPSAVTTAFTKRSPA